MEDNLKELKETMDKTIFKKVPFDRNKSINSILTFQEKENKNRRRFFSVLKPRLIEITGIIVCFCLLFFSLNGLLNKDQIIGNHQKEKVTDKRASVNNLQYPDIIEPETSSKKDILFRMLNTIDYFKSVQGTYAYENHDHPDNNYTVSYALRMGENQYQSYSKKIDKNSDTLVQVVDSKALTITRIFPSQKKYYINKLASPFQKGKPIQIDEIISKTGAGSAAYISRDRPEIGAAFESLFNSEFVQSYLVLNQNWEIESQNTDLFGFKSIIIKGSINDRNIKSFRIWVNSPAGIILKMETYDSQGKVIESLQTQNIKLNEPVDETLFKTEIPTDYSEKSRHSAG